MTSWRVMNLPYMTTNVTFATWLEVNKWVTFKKSTIRKRVRRKNGMLTASFTFRGSHPDGPDSCHKLEIEDEEGDSIFAFIEPFRPPTPDVKYKELKNSSHG